MILFDEYVIKQFAKGYRRALTVVAASSKIDTKMCFISNYALASVLREVQKDCLILKQRRAFNKGLSAGKIAGVLVFRLCRTQTLFFHQDIINSSDALQMPVNIAVLIGLEMCGVNIASVDESVLRELKYFLAKRHINQEALGMCFDVFKNMLGTK